MSSQQLAIDFDLRALPRPLVTEDDIDEDDVEIAVDVLAIPKKLRHGLEVLQAIERLSGPALTEQIHRPAKIGYTAIRKVIREHHGIWLRSSSIGLTIHELLELGYLKRVETPGFHEPSEYQSLTRVGVLDMLRGVNATHFRVYRNQLLLIAPPSRSPHVI